MSLQVGAFCYADAVEAGRAACASYGQVTSMQGTHLLSATCYDVNPTTGALYIRIADTDTIAHSTVFNNVSHLESFPACTNADYIAAFEILISGALMLWAMWYGAKKLLSMLDHSRGSNE